MSGEKFWQSETERHMRDGLARQIHPLKFLDASHCVDENGRLLFAACTNDYLGLRFHPAVAEAASAAMWSGQFGSGGARLTTGAYALANKLEGELADFKGCEAALLFNSGYTANIGLLSAIGGRDCVIFSDENNHASIIDGCRLSRAKIVAYPHRNTDQLRELMEEYRQAGSLFIVTDGVFSMDGTIAPIPDLLDLAEEFDANLIIDDAHALGVLGERGIGTLEHFSVTHQRRIIQVGTCSKALGSFGGFVCGSAALVQYLRQCSRPFIFSTMLPESTLAATAKALQLLQEEQDRTIRLKRLSRITWEILAAYGIPFPGDAVAIFPLLIGDESAAAETFATLYQSGIYLSAIRYPSVPRGSARLRLSISSEYRENDLTNALHSIARAVLLAKNGK
jgi:8-amino-7-oxononanoate synthase